nr:RecQ family ATP-dependent DNA helicase [Allomuricauda sp.]
MQYNIHNILKEFWGYKDFRGSQKDIIHSALDGQDTLALMPTGGGKSLCYQVPAMALSGICIVVSPLVALIQDQVKQLKQRGIKAIALTGGIPYSELNDLLDNCQYGNYKFLYLSPERLQQSIIQERIREMEVSLIAIDEAHCISQWGNDFRPAYLQCSLLKELAPGVATIALTATATPKVEQDIIQNLKLDQPKIYKDSFSRSNISFKVKHTEDKNYQLKKVLSRGNGSSIVYVRSRKMTLNLSEFLNKNGIKSTFFHGGISKQDKEEKLAQWLQGKVQCMVATNAFGMGVDKPDVRCVIHYQIPDSLESYFQEAGRAGRDGQPSEAIILTANEDADRAKQQFLASLPKVEFVKKLYLQLNNFFQIPFGELVTETLNFKFNQFCERYGFNPNMAYHGLRILDQHSVISLSENFNEKTVLKFVASRNGIFQYLHQHPTSAPIIQTILRTYGGITEHPTKINLHLIAKKTGANEADIKKTLERLRSDGVAEYQSSTSDLELNFLVPREDDRTINPFAKYVEDFHTLKNNNMKAMLDYVGNQKICRSVFILHYFGEKSAQNCGTCDICTQENVAPSENLKNRITRLLATGGKTSRDLESELGVGEKLILDSLQEMLEDGEIQLNERNEYEIEK